MSSLREPDALRRMITGLNHITVSVSDLSRSLDFYCDVLGFRNVHEWGAGAYLKAGDLWLCLSVGEAVSPARDYSHFALTANATDIASLSDRAEALRLNIWQENISEGASLYLLDPDGHKLELHDGDLTSRMNHIRST